MRLNWMMVALLAGLVTWGSGDVAISQTAAPIADPQTQQPIANGVSDETDPTGLAVSTAVEAAEEKLAAAEANIARLSERIAEDGDDDGALVDLKLELETLADGMLDIGVSLRPRLSEIKARMELLGPAPANGEPAEPDPMAEERTRLAGERVLINSLTGRAENITVRAGELGDQITDERRELFSKTLFKRTEIGPSMLPALLEAMDMEIDQLTRIYGAWAKFVWAYKWQALMAWAFCSLLAAMVLIPGAYRLFGSLIQRNSDDEGPSYPSRLSVAFWSTIIPTVAATALAGAVYGMLDGFAILRADIAPVISSLLIVLVATFFISKLARGILAPRMPEWRLVNISNGGARVLYILAVALVVVNGLDYVEGQLSRSLGSPVILTVFKGVISVFLMAVMLIGMALVRPMVAASGDPADPGQPWPKFISISLLAAGVGLLATVALGYVGLARFAATQIVVTGAILTTMYIGYLSGRAISQADVFALTAIGRQMETRLDLGPVGLDQTGLAAGLLINLLVLLAGVPLILLQWGFQVQDIELWIYRILTEIRIGGITISLMGIFFGVSLFVAGLLATRWFQRWLDGSVMARSRMDTGVRNSVRTGVGYLGVAVAGLIGISAAGIDLSNLALVAGALSLGIGFGLQNIVSNFVSGLILLAERPFKVGDWVVTGSTEGFVKKISVRATEIETFARQSIIVPNSELINSPVGNWTHRNHLGRIEVQVGVSYDADPRMVAEILDEVTNNHELILKHPPPVVYFAGFGDSSLDFEIKAHLADVLSGLSARTELRLRIFERLKAEGIEIPFPQRDLNIKLDDEAEAVLKEKIPTMKGPAGSKAEKRPKVANTTVSQPTASGQIRRKTRSQSMQDSMQDSMEDGSGPDGGGDR